MNTTTRVIAATLVTCLCLSPLYGQEGKPTQAEVDEIRARIIELYDLAKSVKDRSDDEDVKTYARSIERGADLLRTLGAGLDRKVDDADSWSWEWREGATMTASRDADTWTFTGVSAVWGADAKVVSGVESGGIYRPGKGKDTIGLQVDGPVEFQLQSVVILAGGTDIRFLEVVKWPASDGGRR